MLSEAGQHINTVLEISAVMRQLVTTALDLIGATDGTAARLLNGKMTFKEYNLHDKWMPIDFEFESGYGVPGWVMQTRAPYTTNDAEHDPHVIPDIQKALGFHNLADVPIINRHGELLGCFEIHNKPDGFNDTDLLMLQGLAASAAIALENAELLAERTQAEQTVRAASQKLALHFKQSPLAVIEWDTSFRVARWNPSAERIFGFTTQEAIGQHGLFIVPESAHAILGSVMEKLLKGEGDERSTNENVRKDGVIILCDWYNTSLIDAEGRVVGVASQVQDITERKAAEARIQRLTQLYLVLSQCNQAIVRSPNEGELFAEICRGAVLFGGMKMAWIGRVDRAIRRVEPVAFFGDDFNYLKGIQISLDESDPLGRGPVGTAVREDRPSWFQDFQNDPLSAPWHELCARSGWRAVAALPLHQNGEVIASLALYSGHVNAFDEDARNLLMEMAADISHAMDAFDLEAQRKQAEDTLRASLREKESLLKEVHHRVKNNLQVITSLLRLEAGRSDQPDTKSVLKEMQNRIRSMALLHETLYRSENLERVDLPGYIKQLTTHLYRSMVPEPGSIQLHLDLAPVSLALDQAVPCGLLVNELVSNCLKHAFPDGRTGEVRIDLQLVDGGQKIRLRVSDTGVGLPTDFEEKRTKSLGLQLVSDLIKQLNGQIEIGGGPGTGAVFEVTFAPKRQAEAIT